MMYGFCFARVRFSVFEPAPTEARLFAHYYFQLFSTDSALLRILQILERSGWIITACTLCALISNTETLFSNPWIVPQDHKVDVKLYVEFNTDKFSINITPGSIIVLCMYINYTLQCILNTAARAYDQTINLYFNNIHRVFYSITIHVRVHKTKILVD